MSEGLSIPGRGPENPLKDLRRALEASHTALVSIAESQAKLVQITTAQLEIAKEGRSHTYGVAPASSTPGGEPDGWGSYCLACSASEATYVYPCRLEPEDAARPPAFIAQATS